MEIRDPVHGLVFYSDLEEQVINSRPMQRLRGIRQLAMANLVYPGALHTRFDHSIGAMHVAGRIAEQLNAVEKEAGRPEPFAGQDIENIRLAALLHDVGHGPFSHVSEAPLRHLSGGTPDQETDLPTEKLHELITCDLVRHHRPLRGLLGERAEDVGRILDPRESGEGAPKLALARLIVSGPLDADKLDYLLRDSYFCGVKYGIYDLDRVLNGLRIITGPDKRESYVGIHEESVYALEQHLLARYHMTLQVYRHRIRRITDALLSRAIILAAKEGCERVRTLYTYHASSQEFLENWLGYDDWGLLTLVRNCMPDSQSARIADMLCLRELPRRVRQVRLKDLPLFGQKRLRTGKDVCRLEHQLAERLGCDASLVIVDVVEAPLPRPSSLEPGIDLEDILVETGAGTATKFSEVSQLFRGNPLTGTEDVLFCAPFTAVWKGKRDKERECLGQVVMEVLGAMGSDSGEEA